MKDILDARVTIPDTVLSQQVQGESVLLDLAGEQYFALNAVGTRIWELLREDVPLREVHAKLAQEYDVGPAVLEADLLELVARLAEAGLVTLSGGGVDADESAQSG